MRERVAVRRQTLPDGPATGYGLAPARRPLGRRFALLVVLACAGVLALGTASAQAMPASGGSSRSSSADPPAPTVDSQSTSNVGSQTAQLDAQINPQGADTTCKFQYVDDSDFMSTGFTGPDVVTVPCDPQNLGSATSDVSALANISGLQPNTLYDFQAVAHSTGGTIDGGATQFSTGPAASIDSESASNVGPQTAELDAEINPEGNDTTCEFQYVDDTDFMSSGFTGPNVVTVACNPQDLGAGIGDASTLADISGLTPNTTYDFRAVATNSLAPSGLDGSPTQFTTTPAVSVDAESATNITDTDATLNAQLNPEGLDTTYQFEYVTDADYSACSCYTNATTVPATPVDIGSGTTDQAATGGPDRVDPGDQVPLPGGGHQLGRHVGTEAPSRATRRSPPIRLRRRPVFPTIAATNRSRRRIGRRRAVSESGTRSSARRSLRALGTRSPGSRLTRCRAHSSTGRST